MSARRLPVVVVVAVLGAGACGGGTTAPRPSPTQHRGGGSQAGGTATPAPAPRVAWTHDKLLRQIAGRRILVGGRTVQIDPDTVVCGGVGRPAAQQRGRPAWSRFSCLQPTFPPGAVVGPDAVFFVQPTGGRTFDVVGARLTHY
jgi:hypothetical protein